MKSGNLRNFKKISIVFMLVIGFILPISSSMLGGVFYAASAYKNPLTNPTFNQSYNSEYISSLNGWSVISYDGYTTARDKDGYKSGSVKASSVTNSAKESDDKLWKNFGLLADPGKANQHSTDSKYNTYLMLNSPTTLGRIGYQTSSEFTLDANSFYKITVTFKTQNNISSEVEIVDQDAGTTKGIVESNSFASIYIKGLSDDSFSSLSKFEKISTNNRWTTRTFYISTTPFASEKLKLELWLGGEKVTDHCQGAVFFNDVDIERFNETFYQEETNKISSSNDTVSVIDLDTNPYITDELTNPNFEQGWTGWSQLPLTNSTASDKLQVVNLASSFFPYNGINTPHSNNTSHANRNAVLIYLANDGFLGIKSRPINIKANGYYRLSVWTISDANEGEGGTVRVVELDSNGERKLDSAKSLTAPTTVANKNNNRNGWVQYNFYIQGNALEDKLISLELSLGTEEKTTKGYVFYDDVTLQQISHANFLRASSDTKTEILNLENSNEKLFMIANHSFNHVTQTGVEQVVYPAEPNAWTYDEKTKYTNSGVINGVINTNPTHFNENKQFYPAGMPNPGSIKYDDVSNNVLVMGSKTTGDKLTYTSESFSFEKNKTYYLSFYFNSHVLDTTHFSKMSMKVFNNNFVISEHELSNTNNNWKQFVFEINTGLISGSFQLQLSLENTNGYVFFDEFVLTSTPHLTDRYAQKIIVDTNKNNFASFNNFRKTSTHDSQTYTNVTNKNLSFLEYSGIENISYASDGNKSALYILNETKAITTAESTNTFALTGGQFYKISAWIKTSMLEGDEKHENFGASFAVNYGDTVNEHKAIVTNEYTKYNFYINPENDIDAKIIFGLGGKHAPVYGIAFFDGLEITTFETQAEFEEDQEDKIQDTIKVIAAAIETDEDDHDHDADDHDHDHNNSSNILMAASGIITGVAIIIAMLGTGIRKIKWRRPTRVATTYDRRKTLNKSLDRQELIKLHENLIKEVEEELAQEKETFKEREEIISYQIGELNKKLDEETAELKDAFKKLEKEKDEKERQLNAKLAENKAGTTLKDDRECEKQISGIVASQKKIQKAISKIENKYESEIYKLENMLVNLAIKPQSLEQEIADLKKEMAKIKEKEKSAALKPQKSSQKN